MLYRLHELQRLSLDAISTFSEMLRAAPLPWVRANAALLHRSTRPYPKPSFGLGETVELARPFCRLLRFAGTGPRVLVIAPLSGHHATLVRDTVTTIAQHHAVFVTDWLDARAVPLAAGTFSLDAYVAEPPALHPLPRPAARRRGLPAHRAGARRGGPRGRERRAHAALADADGRTDRCARVNPTVVNRQARDRPPAVGGSRRT